MLTASIIQKVTQGIWLNPPLQLHQKLIGGCFDTREIKEQNIFFAWKGMCNDGHNYLTQLKGTSIQIAIVEKKNSIDLNDMAVLLVNDSLASLHAIATYCRKKSSAFCIALTGSSGKTSTKDWLYEVLSQKYSVLANVGSYNNNIGCPITLLSLQKKHQIIILEMGTSGKGEIKHMVQIAQPHLSVLLNVGFAHLGKFCTINNIYQAKLEIFLSHAPKFICLIPNNDQKIRDYVTLHKIKYIAVGEGTSYYIEIGDVSLEKYSQSIIIHSPQETKKINIPIIGAHCSHNLPFVIACAQYLNLSWQEILLGLSSLQPAKQRMNIYQKDKNYYVIDDTYNANPQSVVNLLATLALLKNYYTIAIIGNLAELEENLTISAQYIYDNFPKQINKLYLTGDSGITLWQKFHKGEYASQVEYYDSYEKIISALDSLKNTHLVVAIKGSRASKTEKIVQQLLTNTSHK